MAPGLSRRAGSGVAALTLAACLLGACGAAGATGTTRTVPPPAGPRATPTTAMERARAAVEQALGARRVQVTVPQVPVRPGEAPAFAAAPRVVLQAVLPQDRSHGFISVYGFRDADAAAAAAREQADYVGSPIGRVQFPTGTQFVIRQLESAVVFYAAVPGGSPDPLAADIPGALETIGTGVAVPG